MDPEPFDSELPAFGLAVAASACASAPAILALLSLVLRPYPQVLDSLIPLAWPLSALLALVAAAAANANWSAARGLGQRPDGWTIAALGLVGVTLLVDLVPCALLPFVMR